MKKDISNMRREYLYAGMDESEMDPDPVIQFADWFQKAADLGMDLPNAMALATATSAGIPSVRYVLMKEFNQDGFVFYSHSVSIKGRELAENPNAAIVFYWAPMDRQVRISGRVVRVSDEEADEYFSTRPYDSKVTAWISRQSAIVESRDFLEEEYYKVTQEFPGEEIPRPEDWVGYRLIPDRIEFWQGREGRLHDRIEYLLNKNGRWSMCRLAP